jgi:hypothetical protein
MVHFVQHYRTCAGWQRQAEPAELADGVPQYMAAIGKLRLPLPPILNAPKCSQNRVANQS